MNPSVVNELTMAAGVAGYAAGMLADEIAVRHAAKRQAPVLASWALAGERLDEAAKSGSRVSRFGRYTASLLFAPMALSAGAAAGLNTYAWSPETAIVEQTPPTLEVGIDHSGATGLSIDGKPVVSEINHLVDEVSGLNKVKTVGILSSAGTVVTVDMAKVAENTPFGPSDMPSVASLALSQAAQVPLVTKDGSLKPKAGVLLITNGNTVGNPASIIADATQQVGSDKVTTPVFVVNVEGDKAGTEVTNSLMKIADKTGGKYWSADKGNLDSVAKEVRSKIVSTEASAPNGPDKTPIKWLGGLAGAALIAVFIGRGSMPFRRGIKG